MKTFFDLIINENQIAQQVFNNIVEEIYVITKHTNISYGDVERISTVERKRLLNLISNDLHKEQEARQRAMEKSRD